MTKYLKFSIPFLATVLLSACTTVKIPDLSSLPGFKESAENVGEYPNASEAPATPNDIRSDDQWDRAARQILKGRNDFDAPKEASDGFKSEAQIIREMNALKAKVEEYKLDDPVE